MTVLSIPALVMAVIAFYVSGYHFLIFLRRPESRIDFTFALTAMCIGFYDIFCVALYNTASPIEGVQIQRWQLISLSCLSIAYVWFVVDYTSMKSRVGPWLFSVIFLIFILIGLFDNSGLAWTDQPLIKNFQFPFFGWDITYYEMEFGKVMLFEAFMLMVFYLYLYCVGVHFYWKKNPKRARPLVLAIGLFMLGMTEDVFVALGYYNFVYTIEYAFMGMILVMAYTLSSEIVERGKIQQEFRESEAKQKEMIANISDVIAILGSDGTVKYKSPNIQKWFGWHPEDLVGTDGWETVHPDDLERVQKDFLTLLNKDNSTITVEYRYKCKDGSYKLIELTAVNLTNDSVINGVLVNYHDVTERKRTEKALRESEERLQAIIDNAPTVIYLKDPQGKFILINSRFEKLFHITREEIIGKTDYDIFPEKAANAMRENDQKILDADEAVEFEELVPHDDGQHTYISIKFPIRDASGVPYGVCGISTDITDRRKLEAQLQQAQKMESIGTLAGGIAHDFNNILSPIMIHSEMVMMDLPSGSPLQQNMKQVYMAGERARDLVKQILTFARKQEKARIPLKISQILKEAVNLLRSTLPATIDIKYENSSERDTVFSDPTQLNQIIMNLGTNAAQAMEEKGGTLEVILTNENIDSGSADAFPDLAPGRYAKLIVKDTGTGIEPHRMDKIFEPYYTTKEVGKGTGMGLALVHGIVKSHGGLVTVQSETDKGTSFHVYLPLVEGDMDILPETAKDSVRLSTGTERILLVDDEKAAVDVIQAMLERLGYEVTARTSSIEALEAFRNGPDGFDLVITDMTMPNMTGKDLAKKLMSIRPGIPIILCTGFSEKIDERNAEEMGISAYIMKPIVMREFADTIREVLGNKK
jgi:PAS domain S-box-containing protein